MTFESLARRNAVRPSPVFLLIVALAAAAGGFAWTVADPTSWSAKLSVFAFIVFGWLVSMCLHEFAHAYAAYRAGDIGVETRGYLTLNPMKYSHPLLSIGLPLAFIALGGFGLPGGAVYVHKQGLKPATQRMISLAGPMTNALCAVALLITLRAANLGDYPTHVVFWSALSFQAFLQITATIFNLIPVPGLDGYGVLEPSLSWQTRRQMDQFRPYGLLIVMAVLWYRPVNTAFFDAMRSLFTGLSGASDSLVSNGLWLTQFWNH
jgi:Zn-dependent protease